MNANTGEIWTVGHSTRSIEEFAELLLKNNLNAIADVRRFPGSRRHPQFGQVQLSSFLADRGIKYFHLPELGGRRSPRPDSPNTAWRNAAFRGYADYMMTEEFRSGIGRLLKIAETSRTAIMCAEAVWWRCHRSLIADHLKSKGYLVRHILSPTKVVLHPFSSAAQMSNGQLSYGERNMEPELPMN